MISLDAPLRRRLPTALLVALVVACGAQRGDQDPPLELVLANLEETDVTVALRTTGASQLEEVGVYVTWEIEAEILEVYKGDLSPGDPIEYRRTVERGTTVPEAGTRHIVSFVREDGELMIPDVGYHFPYSRSLADALKAARE